MAQNIKYWRPGLGTGGNTGLTWADAWQDEASFIAGVAAGDRVRVPNGTVTMLVKVTLTTSGTIGDGRITLVSYDEPTDTEWTIENWTEYGGSIGTVLDWSAAGADEGIRTFGRTYWEFLGIEFKGRTYGLLIGDETIVRGCKFTNCTSMGFYSTDSSVIHENIITENCAIGTNATGQLNHYMSIDDTIGYNGITWGGNRWILSGATTAVKFGSNTNPISNISIYDCVTAFLTSQNQYVLVENAIVDTVTNLFNLAAATHKLVAINVKYRNVTNKVTGLGAANYLEYDGVEEVTDAMFTAPATGNFTPIATVAAIKNVSSPLDATNIDYAQMGALTQQVVASGGGAQLGAFETGAWR
jgi:hypothetical protein